MCIRDRAKSTPVCTLRLLVASIAHNLSSKIDLESYNSLPLKVIFPSSTLPEVVNRNNWLLSKLTIL